MIRPPYPVRRPWRLPESDPVTLGDAAVVVACIVVVLLILAGVIQ